MTKQAHSPYQERIHQQLAYWDQFRQPQPLGEGAGELEVVPLSGQGTVYSFTTVTTPAQEFEPFAPYVLGMVQLDEGPLVTAQLTDLDGPPEIGMRVEMVVRKLRTDGRQGIIIYGPKFRPVLVSAGRRSPV